METNPIILEAIARQKCLFATYNRSAFKLAPYILYTRHGELYVDAVAVKRDGLPPREIKLGTFKVAGLSDVAVDDERFSAQPIFDPAAAKYDGTTLFAIEV
jgi:WYL domain